MKKIVFGIFTLITVNVFSQSFNVQSAADAFKHLKYSKDSYKDLSDGKKFIDLAAANEQTANDPKMWYYRGMIYLRIDQDTLDAVKNLDADAIEKSAISFINCFKTDEKKNYTEECNSNIWVAG